MAVKVVILRDIQLRESGHVFTKRCSTIEYDAKKPIDKKLHRLAHQQGERYGTVGDCCEYLTHERLLRLAEEGYVRIENKKKPRARKPTLAQILYDAYRDSSNSKELLPALETSPPEFQKAWEQVAEAAQEWAYENIQWQE